MKLSQMTGMPKVATKQVAKVNNYTYPREDADVGSQAIFDISQLDAGIVQKLEELLDKGVVTKSGKEAYAVLTFPRGSITGDVEYKDKDGNVTRVVNEPLLGMRMALTVFVTAA